MTGRPLAGAAFFLSVVCAALASGCDDDGAASPTEVPPPATAVASATAAPPPDLASQIGSRGDLPQHVPIDLAARFGRTQGRAPASRPAGPEPSIGHTREFQVLQLTGGALTGRTPPGIDTVSATLRAKSEHAYFYIDDRLDAGQDDADAAARAFEDELWPAVTGVFGVPPTPGVDGDPRIIVLQADLGGAVGGFHAGDDRYLREVRPNSNEAEMVYMDRTLRLGGAAFNVVLAHELQHLIHGASDDGEEAWVNEGLSETASSLVGGLVSSVNAFAAEPDTQLNDWTTQGSLPHYGAGAAFFRYLAGRFGTEALLGEIARVGADGEAGLDQWLAGRGQTLSFSDVFADWVAANALSLTSGPHGNAWRQINVDIESVLTADEPIEREAVQFGTHYYLLDVAEDVPFTLSFAGHPDTPVLPVTGRDAGPLLWGNRGDMVDTTLTREIDLSALTSPDLVFRTWFDIERWFDWGYIAISTDGGSTWTPLTGQHTTADDPIRSALGVGYTGKSGGGDTPAWINERIDLTPFAGRKVLLRFEYVTDSAAHGEGWAINEVVVAGQDIPLDDPGWERAGWVHVAGPLRQTFLVRLVADRNGEPVVIDVPLDAEQAGTLNFNAGGLTDAVVAVAGTTEGTRQRAPYTITLRRADPPPAAVDPSTAAP